MVATFSASSVSPSIRFLLTSLIFRLIYRRHFAFIKRIPIRRSFPPRSGRQKIDSTRSRGDSVLTCSHQRPETCSRRRNSITAAECYASVNSSRCGRSRMKSEVCSASHCSSRWCQVVGVCPDGLSLRSNVGVTLRGRWYLFVKGLGKRILPKPVQLLTVGYRLTLGYLVSIDDGSMLVRCVSKIGRQ